MPQQRRRNTLIIGLLALGLLAGAALTGSPAQAVDAVGPYYAKPAWDRKMGVVNRFVVLTDWNSEAVLDKETGLVWERSPASGDKIYWEQARIECLTRTTFYRKGWRLPSVHELASLIDPSRTNPALPLGHPFLNVQTDYYWSATAPALSEDDQGSNWLVGVGSNGLVGTSDNPIARAWCVRGGMNADQY